MSMPALVRHEVPVGQFIEFWASLYQDPLESIYTENIGKPLTPERIDKLFMWKNGGNIARKKAESIRSNYHHAPARLDALGETPATGEIWGAVGGGGVVWGVFMLHIWRPTLFPILDQHVYRAMRWIQSRELVELNTLCDHDKIEAYLGAYLAFWRELAKGLDARQVDKALWSFGKAIKPVHGSGLNWNSILTEPV